jgi:hypothetical protein
VSRDLYDVLGVPGTASEAEIRHAFWVLAKKYHPDVSGGDPDAARRFAEVGNAAETLLDRRRRASYDESRAPKAGAGTTAAGPKPPPPPSSSRASNPRAGATPPPAAPAPASHSADWLDRPRNALAVLAAIAVAVGFWVWLPAHSPQKKNEGGMPLNGSVVWKTAGFGLDDGWGINLAGGGARIQIVPGTSADIEVTGGYLASAGHIALLPRGAALTYQHCVTAVQQGTSQSEPLSEIAPASGSGACVAGSGGDLASVQVTRDDGANLTVNITVWEDV